MDYSLKNSEDSPEAKRTIENILKESGAKGYVKDEYLDPSENSTGGHMHTQFNTEQDAAIFQKYWADQNPDQTSYTDAKALPGASEGYLNTNAVNSSAKTATAANSGKPPVVNVSGGKGASSGNNNSSAPPASRGGVKCREDTLHSSQQTDFSGSY